MYAEKFVFKVHKKISHKFLHLKLYCTCFIMKSINDIQWEEKVNLSTKQSYQPNNSFFFKPIQYRQFYRVIATTDFREYFHVDFVIKHYFDEIVVCLSLFLLSKMFASIERISDAWFGVITVVKRLKKIDLPSFDANLIRSEYQNNSTNIFDRLSNGSL